MRDLTGFCMQLSRNFCFYAYGPELSELVCEILICGVYVTCQFKTYMLRICDLSV